jgi:DNA-binding transcriptional LysR family regulator
MAKSINWDARIGRRVRLRDLHILLAVVQHGSMARAAAQLNVTQPAISDAIATLEAALGVRLLDRSRKGVEPTSYGLLLLKYGQLAIDDLRQGVKEIEFLADPTAGELRVGCPDSIASGILVPIIQRLADRYPRVRVHVDVFAAPRFDFPELEHRRVDLVVGRLSPQAQGRGSLPIEVEILFDDRVCVVAGWQSPFARQTNIDLAVLAKARWIMTPTDVPPAGPAVQKLFLDAGLQPPEFMLSTFSVVMRIAITSAGQCVSTLPGSVLRLHTDKLRELPIVLPIPRWPVAIVTLKDRALNPAARLFIECAREVTKPMAKEKTVENEKRAPIRVARKSVATRHKDRKRRWRGS